jgi:Peptidase inhibitor I78 family
MTLRHLAVTAMLVLLVACASSMEPPTGTAAVEAATPVSSGPVAPVDPANLPPGTSAMRCNAGKIQSTIGQAATQDVIDRAVADSTSGAVRVIKPGDAVTADYSEGRLNLEVDANNVITKASCG